MQEILNKIEAGARADRLRKYGTADVDYYGRPLITQHEREQMRRTKNAAPTTTVTALQSVGFE